MRWLEKDEYKAKMECIRLLRFNQLNISEKDRKYELAIILSDRDNEKCGDYRIFKKWLIDTYGLKEKREAN